MPEIKFQRTLGDIELLYVSGPQGQPGLTILPSGTDPAGKEWLPEPLVQLHLRGDAYPGAYESGHSLSASPSAWRFALTSQTADEHEVITTLSDGLGHILRHIVHWEEGWEAVTIASEFRNESSEPVVLEDLSSFCLSGISPLEAGDAPGTLVRHQFKSFWSAEGRLVSDPIERLGLEPSWSGHGVRLEKIGQVGSMPVRSCFPFDAVEDTQAQVVWAAQLAINASWQIELKRKDDGLSLYGGLGDFDFAHWAKEVKPGETFRSPDAFVTVVSGDLTDACERLLTIQKSRNKLQPAVLPLLFNEYCTTWGVPSDENLTRILEKLRGRGIDCLVMDCGWFIEEGSYWFEANGDWNISPKLFPNGLKSLVDKIHAAGMKAGIWFELETCGPKSRISRKDEWMLHRHGQVYNESGKRYLDLRKPEVTAYLDEKVIGLLKDNGFDYIKVDYNGTLGIGCDGAESLGEGLRQVMEASKAFFRRMEDAIPGLMIENCSSGGHRLEPSMMEVSTMASFSDAHECVEIPVIAANLHHLILPGQSQIWAVLRAEDSLKRLTWSLTAGMLGVLCLSGDVENLSEAQTEQVFKGADFYKQAAPIIRDGKSRLYREGVESYRHPEGWQALVRTADDGRQALVVLHRFAGEGPLEVSVPVACGSRITNTYTDGSAALSLQDGILTCRFEEGLTGAAVLIG